MDRWLFSVFSRAVQRFFAASEVLSEVLEIRGDKKGAVYRESWQKGWNNLSLFYFRICLRKISVRFFFKQEDNRII